MTDRLTCTPSEAADRLGCSAEVVRRMVNEGVLPCLPRRGARSLILIPVVALERYVQRAVEGSAA